MAEELATYPAVIKYLASIADAQRAKNLQQFFKTGPGEYGEGDQFIGLRVPQVRRAITKIPVDKRSKVAAKLARSAVHEHRLLALLIMTKQYSIEDQPGRDQLIKQYLRLAEDGYVNNWDLVDLSAPNILGRWSYDNHDQVVIQRYCNSGELWQQRIAVLATFYFIRANKFELALGVADKLIDHQHDLIHKAVGWMLREIGKRDFKVEGDFLRPRYQLMPRTMLRYAIERFDEDLRQRYLSGQV